MLKKYPKHNNTYICRECAIGTGATWPDGHLATFHNSICDICLKEKSVCHKRNWNWPKDNI